MADSPGFFSRVKNTISPKPDYSKKPIGFHWRSHTLFIVATVGIGLFTDLFLYGLVVPILPFLLKDRVGTPDDQIQSHVSGLLVAYAASSVVFSPLAGAIADKTSSRQAPYLAGLSALILATIMFFSGQSIAVLTIARVLQGASSAFVWTVGLALCIDTVGPENLGKTIGSVRPAHKYYWNPVTDQIHPDLQLHLRRRALRADPRRRPLRKIRHRRRPGPLPWHPLHRPPHALLPHREEGRRPLRSR